MDFEKIARDEEKGILFRDMEVSWWVFPGIFLFIFGFCYGWAKILWFFGSHVENAKDPLEALLWIIGAILAYGGVLFFLDLLDHIIDLL